MTLINILNILSRNKARKTKMYFDTFWENIFDVYIMLFPSKALLLSDVRNDLMFGLSEIFCLRARHLGYVWFFLISAQTSGNWDSVARRT